MVSVKTLPQTNASINQFKKKGYGVLSAEYGSFGNSTGKLSKKSIKQNSKLILQYLENKGIKDKNISVVGFSMESFPSVDFITKNKNTNFLVLISPSIQ